MARATNGKYDQPIVDPALLPKVERAISNRSQQIPRCPLCSWQGQALPWDSRDEILNKIKRHIRTKHRGYYNIATKPYVIKEEEDVSLFAR